MVNFHVNLHVFRPTKLDPLPVVSRVSYNSTSRGYFTPVTHVFSAIFFRGPITPLTPGVGGHLVQLWNPFVSFPRVSMLDPQFSSHIFQGPKDWRMVAGRLGDRTKWLKNTPRNKGQRVYVIYFKWPY